METYLGLHALEGEWHGLLPRYLLVAGYLTGLRVLEIGCGLGLGTSVLIDVGGADVVAIDHRPELIQAARGQFEAHAQRFEMMFYEEMDFEDGSFDVVLCLNDEFPIDDEALLHEVTRVLRPGGTFVGAWSELGTYGLDKVLPRLGDAMQSRPMGDGRTFADARAALGAVFPHVVYYEQVPELGFLFRPSLKTWRTVVDDPESQNETVEFDIEAARRRQRDAEALARNITTPSEDELVAQAGVAASSVDRSLLVRGEAFRAGFELAACSSEARGCRLLELGSGVRVQLPYYGVAARLGRVLNDLYRHMDDLGQTNLMLETQMEETSRLVDDLEEEVRSLRSLIRDQARRLEAQDTGLDGGAGRDSLARQQELQELSMGFELRLGDAQRSIGERDAYIDRLADAVGRWERYANSLQQELDGRALALTNLRFALERRDAENAELRAALSATGPAASGYDRDTVPMPAVRSSALLAPPTSELDLLRARLEAVEQAVASALASNSTTVELPAVKEPWPVQVASAVLAEAAPEASAAAVDAAVTAEPAPAPRRRRSTPKTATAETAPPAQAPRPSRARRKKAAAPEAAATDPSASEPTSPPAKPKRQRKKPGTPSAVPDAER